MAAIPHPDEVAFRRREETQIIVVIVEVAGVAVGMVLAKRRFGDFVLNDPAANVHVLAEYVPDAVGARGIDVLVLRPVLGRLGVGSGSRSRPSQCRQVLLQRAAEKGVTVKVGRFGRRRRSETVCSRLCSRGRAGAVSFVGGAQSRVVDAGNVDLIVLRGEHDWSPWAVGALFVIKP